MKSEGLKKRYVIKLISSVVIAVLNIIIQLLLPRAFSLEEYGYYTYNLNLFTSIVIMANLSTSNAMASKLAKRNDEIGIVNFYLKFYLIMGILLSVAIFFLYPLDFIQSTLDGQTLMIVVLGFQSAIIMKLLTDVVSIYDAFAISKTPAIIQIILKVSLAVCSIFLFFFGNLNLLSFYLYQGVLTAFFTSCLLINIYKEQKKRYPQKKDLGTANYLKEYYKFCKPLVISTAFSQIVIVLINWTLMHFGGAREQALFGAAWQLNTLVSYIFSPYAELSKREFAILVNNKDLLSKRLVQSLRLMIWVTSYFSIFIGVTSDWSLPIIYGDKYVGAKQVTLLIMVYTIYQAWGQLSGSFMLALELSKLNAILSIAMQILTLILVFIFQVPNYIWPAGLGAIGIGLTYLFGNLISVNISVAIIAKKLQLPIFKVLSVQILPIGICALVSEFIYLAIVTSNIFNGAGIIYYLLKLLLSGTVYTVIIATFIFFKPNLLGISRENILSLIKRR